MAAHYLTLSNIIEGTVALKGEPKMASTRQGIHLRSNKAEYLVLTVPRDWNMAINRTIVCRALVYCPAPIVVQVPGGLLFRG
jgi:hypothetical protein